MVRGPWNERVNAPKPLRVRRLREQLNAVYEYVDTLDAPVREGYRTAPVIVRECFDRLLTALDEFDRQLAKIDSEPGAVGDKIKLSESENSQEPPT